MLVGCGSQQMIQTDNSDRQLRLERKVNQLCRLLEANLVANDYCSNRSGKPGCFSSLLTPENFSTKSLCRDCAASNNSAPRRPGHEQLNEDTPEDISRLDRVTSSLDSRGWESRISSMTEWQSHRYNSEENLPSDLSTSDLCRQTVSNEQICTESLSCLCMSNPRKIKYSQSFPKAQREAKPKISRPRSLNNLSSPPSSPSQRSTSWTPNITALQCRKLTNCSRTRTARVHFPSSLLTSTSAADVPRLPQTTKSANKSNWSSSRFSSPSSS